MGKSVEPSQWLSMIASFGLVLVLLLGTLWVLRRIGATGLRAQTGRRLAVVESLWVGNRQRVVLVRFDQREILLGVSAQGISRLDVSPSGGRVPSDSPDADTSPSAESSAVEALSSSPPASARARFLDAMRSVAGRPQREP